MEYTERVQFKHNRLNIVNQPLPKKLKDFLCCLSLTIQKITKSLYSR